MSGFDNWMTDFFSADPNKNVFTEDYPRNSRGTGSFAW